LKGVLYQDTPSAGHFLGDFLIFAFALRDFQTFNFAAFFIKIHLPVAGLNTLPSGHFLGEFFTTTFAAFFINIHLPVAGFSTLPSGHLLGDFFAAFAAFDLVAFFIKIHLPVSGFSTLPPGHFLGDLLTTAFAPFPALTFLGVESSFSVEVFASASLRT
jgi:hypothetical protein